MKDNNNTCDKCEYGIMLCEGELLCDLTGDVKKDYEFIACEEYKEEQH